jgi:hypothetical protein
MRHIETYGTKGFSFFRHALSRTVLPSLAREKVKKGASAGQAILELSLMMPWIFFLFVGALDFGFYSHALISTQNAARVATLNAGFTTVSSASQMDACFHARRELAMMPNAQSFSLTCNQAPLVVTVTPFTDADGSPASRVQVAYDTIPLIPIPGLVTGQQTITRQVSVKVYGE